MEKEKNERSGGRWKRGQMEVWWQGVVSRFEYCLLSLTTTCTFWSIQPLSRYYDLSLSSIIEVISGIVIGHGHWSWSSIWCISSFLPASFSISHSCSPISNQSLGSHSRSSGPRLCGSSSEGGRGEYLEHLGSRGVYFLKHILWRNIHPCCGGPLPLPIFGPIRWHWPPCWRPTTTGTMLGEMLTWSRRW